jgi:beta-lactamase class D
MRRFAFICLASICINFLSCSPNNVTEDQSLKKYFDQNKVSGAFGLFDNPSGQFTIYNLGRFKDSAYLPASTFKIVNALIGIETGVVKDDSTVIKWNGRPWTNATCNADLPMYLAFRNSCVPWFQELAKRIGRDTMQKQIDSLGYGRRYGRPVIKNIDTFWLDNSIKVTADEQLGLVKRLYFEQLPFQARTQRIVKQMMLMENSTNYKLSYKTGLGRRENGNAIGWIIGWIEENRHAYFFALQVESNDQQADIGSVRMKMLKDILSHYGFFKGRK